MASIKRRGICPEQGSFKLLETLFRPGTSTSMSASLSGPDISQTPVVVVNGARPGPVLCLTAALHGDELNGIEIIRKILDGLNPEDLTGVVVGIPIVNLEGFQHRERCIGDHRDLNRCFPGRLHGEYPDLFAHNIFSEIVTKCDALVDMHTGSSRRENLPQVRADLSIERVGDLSSGLSNLSVLQSTAPSGSLREASTTVGIPAIVVEIGSSHGLEPDNVLIGVEGVESLLHSVGMVQGTGPDHVLQHIYNGGGWIKAESEGILVCGVDLGDEVEEGDLIAEIIDPVRSLVHKVISPLHCTILGRAHNQFVQSGFGLFRVGIEHC